MAGDSYYSVDICWCIHGMPGKNSGHAERLFMKEDLSFFPQDEKTKDSQGNECQQRENRRM
jgi:hypothetical protein